MTRCPLCEQEIDTLVRRFVRALIFFGMLIFTAYVVCQIAISGGNQLMDYWIKNHPPKYVKCK